MSAEQRGAASCPVCRARFRSASQCSRCGADLTALMLLASHAYRLRQKARQALRRGDCRAALLCVESAQRLQATPEGNLLKWIASISRSET